MAMHLDNDWVISDCFANWKKPLELAGRRGDSPVRRHAWGGAPGVRVCQLFRRDDFLYGMLRKFGRPKTLAFCAAVILASVGAPEQMCVGWVGMPCSAWGVTTALLAFYAELMRPESGDRMLAWAWALFTVGMAIATLSKGVLGWRAAL